MWRSLVKPAATANRRTTAASTLCPTSHCYCIRSINSRSLRSWSCTRRTFATTNDATSSSSQSSSLHMWGTDTSGCLWKPADQAGESVLSIPTQVDWNEKITGAEPVPKADVQIAKVVCGPTDTAIVLTNGRCFVSGANKYGQLGLGHTNPVLTPTELTLTPWESTAREDASPQLRISEVSLGSQSAAVVDDKGDLWTMGFGGSTLSGLGCLGHGVTESQPTATLVESLVEDGCSVQQVVVGELHTTVLTKEGEVLCTGAGSYGRLGNFETLDQLYLEPVELLAPSTNVVQLAGGKSFTLARTADGIVYGWGRNHKGQLGTGLGLAVDMYAMASVPEPMETDQVVSRNLVHVSAGHSHAAAVTDEGVLLFWGMALHLEPVVVDALAHVKIVDVVCGHDYTVALDDEGRVYSWGVGKSTGVLGHGASIKRLNQPALMDALELTGTQRVKSLSAGYKHAACIVQEA